MITMRAALFVLRTGWPQFNSTDLAQASTSYLLPYLGAALLAVLPANQAILALSLLGILATLSVLLTVLLAAHTRLWGSFLAALLLLTSTVGFSGHGWDHVYQSPLIVAGCLLALQPRWTNATGLAAAVLLFLGCAMRPDGALIAAAALLGRLLGGGASQRRPAWLAASAFLLLSLGMLAINHAVFGHFTPTTSRLKLGAAGQIGGIADYFIRNAVVSYSAMTAALILLAILWLNRARLDRTALVITGGCGLTLAYAILASDAFGGFRMAWTPACVLALVAARRLDPPLQVISPPSTTLALTALLLVACLSFPGQITDRIRALRQVSPGSETAQQYLLARWIDTYLSPSDGAIGWYQLGTAFFLPRFEAADFLGKADEAIAALPPHPGQLVGHNKWDVATTMAKWRPQAILHPWAGDLAIGGERRLRTLQHARDQLALNNYTAHTLVDPAVRAAYLACRPADAPDSLAWGLLLRRDLAASHADALRCLPLAPGPSSATR